jgi:hypothetical protein
LISFIFDREKRVCVLEKVKKLLMAQGGEILVSLELSPSRIFMTIRTPRQFACFYKMATLKNSPITTIVLTTIQYFNNLQKKIIKHKNKRIELFLPETKEKMSFFHTKSHRKMNLKF